ncbi:ferritin-like domain-containing protein [Phlebopus sp. FC_14]|nr:ferritin-like domain-containing protein [Phlebopus sp. FC_14]
MRYHSLASALGLVLGLLPHAAFSFPSAMNAASDALREIQVLNFVLAFEHLGNAFYNNALSKYCQQTFIGAGLPPWARDRWSEMAEHQTTYVSFLRNILGDQAVPPCTYSFPDTDPWSFADLSYLIETVATSAYSGAVRNLLNPDLGPTLAAILAVKARHSAWINSAILDANPWSTAFDTPLDMNHVLTLMSDFVVSCPSPPASSDLTDVLSPKPFRKLALPPDSRPGQTVQLSFESADSNDPLFVWFATGFESTVLLMNTDKTVSIPSSIKGVIYVIVLDCNDTMSSASTVAGPAFLNIDYDPHGQLTS